MAAKDLLDRIIFPRSRNQKVVNLDEAWTFDFEEGQLFVEGVEVGGGGGLTAEGARDIVGTVLTAGDNITIVVDDFGDTVEISASGLTLDVDDDGIVDVGDVTRITFENSDFDVQDAGSGVVVVSLDYGTTAGKPAEGSHTHANNLTINGTVSSAGVNQISFDTDDFTLTNPGVGQITVAAGVHTHDYADPVHTHADLYAAIVHTHTPVEVGLGNVDNTSDAAKPISTLTQVALDAKVDAPLSGIVAIPVGDGTNVIPTGVWTDFQVPFAGTWTANRILPTEFTSGTTGSIVFDIWATSYAAGPPTVANSICASSKPTLSSADKSEDTSITDWTEAFAAGDWFRLNIDSASTVTLCSLVLEYTRS